MSLGSGQPILASTAAISSLKEPIIPADFRTSLRSTSTFVELKPKSPRPKHIPPRSNFLPTFLPPAPANLNSSSDLIHRPADAVRFFKGIQPETRSDGFRFRT